MDEGEVEMNEEGDLVWTDQGWVHPEPIGGVPWHLTAVQEEPANPQEEHDEQVPEDDEEDTLWKSETRALVQAHSEMKGRRRRKRKRATSDPYEEDDEE